MEITGVLAAGAELANNAELGDGAQRKGVGAAQARGARRGRLVGARRTPVCSASGGARRRSTEGRVGAA